MNAAPLAVVYAAVRLVVLLAGVLVMLAGCATAGPAPDHLGLEERARHAFLGSDQDHGMRFAGPDDVPVGRWVSRETGRARVFTLARDGDGFRFEELGDDERVFHSTLTADGRWLTLPGHTGLRFARIDGTPVLEVVYCYERVVAVPM